MTRILIAVSIALACLSPLPTFGSGPEKIGRFNCYIADPSTDETSAVYVMAKKNGLPPAGLTWKCETKDQCSVEIIITRGIITNAPALPVGYTIGKLSTSYRNWSLSENGKTLLMPSDEMERFTTACRTDTVVTFDIMLQNGSELGYEFHPVGVDSVLKLLSCWPPKK